MLSVLAHYQEIALKGRNRPWFLHRLLRNLRTLLEDLDISAIRCPMGRIEIVLEDAADWTEVRDRLSRACGIANFTLAHRIPLAIEGMVEAVVAHLPAEPVDSFCIRVRRADKRFPIPSPALERLLGERVQRARGWRVDLSHPALVVGIEIVPGGAFCSYGKEAGPGGLPAGTAGRVVALLSGGIDSPVAAWRMIRRGCRATFVHFHSYPFLSRTSQDKARELVRLLTRYQLYSRLYLVPFGEAQRHITLTVPGPLRVVVYRRLMFRIAERIAAAVDARALVTGEVVGQVASQTLENLGAISAVTTVPVFRPLIGMDKEEITAQAERLGTYATSIIPDEDCCTLFTPRHPVTRARVPYLDAVERAVPVESLVGSALDHAVVERFRYPTPVVQSPADSFSIGEARPTAVGRPAATPDA